jgi:hypothetical protein
VTLTLPPFDDLSWETEVAFLLDDWKMPFGLLGQQGFLDKWVVSFNGYDQFFVVEPRDAFVERTPFLDEELDPYVLWQGGAYDSEWERPGPS